MAKLLESALSIYEKYEQQQLQYHNLNRDDLHFKLKTGADILIEENGIHIPKPFKFKVSDILEWSRKQDDNLDVVIENYNKFLNDKTDFLNKSCTISYKPYFSTDGFGGDSDIDFESNRPQEKAKKILDFCRKRIYNLRAKGDSTESLLEIEHRRQNIFEVLYSLEKSLESPMLKLYTEDFSLTNQCTILQNVYERDEYVNENGITKGGYKHNNRIYTIGEVVEMLKNPQTNSRAKEQRQLILPHTYGSRLVGEDVYQYWNGLQIFDIDLKFSKSFNELNLSASEIRDELFEHLQNYPWFFAITLSSSGRALHIYTKVSRMHHLFDESSNDENIQISKYWYRMSYIQKFSIISYYLFHKCRVNIYEEYQQKDKVIDSAMAKPQQGIAMNYDPEAKFSNNFVDLYPTIFYHVPPEEGIEDNKWITKQEVLNQFTSWFTEFGQMSEVDYDYSNSTNNLNIIASSDYVVEDVQQIDMSSLSKGEKYTVRWRVCNTIVNIYGDNSQSRKLCHHILQTEETGTSNQIEAFIRSASMHNKEADVYMIKQLASLGLDVQLDEETTEHIADDNIAKIKHMIENSNYVFRQHTPHYQVNLGDNEYLGMRQSQVVNSFKEFHINVIESAPNTGKTEFFKSLAKTSSVCLIIPFTSTIESKILYDEEICKLFDVFYGSKSISDIKKGRSVVMTFDKFSMMPKSKYDMFDYIAIDESHLLFTSVYRLPVVSQTIENIRNYITQDLKVVKNSLHSLLGVQNLMNFVNPSKNLKSTCKFILMSGTLTGELDYFNSYGMLNYIKVNKKHPHNKKATFILSKYANTRDILLFEEIADAIEKGKSVIHPSNSGDGYARRVVECVEYILDRKIKWEYYKRANSDEEFTELINKNTTMEDVELLFCSDYLSVGIDIKDKGKFSLVYSSDFTAESIEQFNNRLRSTDIDCKIFFDVIDEDGMQKPNIININQIQYTHTNEMARMIEDERSIAQLQSSIGNKSAYYAILGQLFSKYFIQDHSGKIKYIKSSFEIEQFDEQYQRLARTLLYIKSSLEKKYQYTVDIDFKDDKSQNELEMFGQLQTSARHEHDLQKSTSFIQIVNFVTDPTYYGILKHKEYDMVKCNDDIELEDIGLHVGSNDTGFTLTYNKKHKLVIEDAVKTGLRLGKFYRQETVNKIMEICMRNETLLNMTELGRYETLMQIMYDDKKNTISASTKELINCAYGYVDPDMGAHQIDRAEYEMMIMDLTGIIRESFNSITDGKELKSERRLNNINMYVKNFVDSLFIKRLGRENVTIRFRKIYKFDSTLITERIEQDFIFNKLLFNDDTEVDPNELHSMSEEHLQVLNLSNL